jgi:hypothetical protein
MGYNEFLIAIPYTNNVNVQQIDHTRMAITEILEHDYHNVEVELVIGKT